MCDGLLCMSQGRHGGRSESDLNACVKQCSKGQLIGPIWNLHGHLFHSTLFEQNSTLIAYLASALVAGPANAPVDCLLPVRTRAQMARGR